MAKPPVEPAPPFGRLCLIAPAVLDLDAFAPRLDQALGAGDVASLILPPDGDAERRLRVAEKLVPIAQANGVAALVANDPRLLAATHADGLLVDTGLADLRRAVDGLRPASMVGAGGIRSRHDAMILAETDCDYLFFGRLDGDTEAPIFDQTLDLAAWWSAVFEIPAIVMGGSRVESVVEAVAARIEFVALRRAIWEHPAGPAEAVVEACRLIQAGQAEAAG